MAMTSDGVFNVSFPTGNSNITGIIATKLKDKNGTIMRTRGGYKMTYQPYMRRTNTYSGTPTQGTINCNFYVNGTRVGGFSGYFKVPNNGDTVPICDPITVTIKDSRPFNKLSYTVGFSSYKLKGGPEAFDVGTYDTNGNLRPLTYSKDDGNSTLKVGAYATPPKVPVIGITDNGDNTCTITRDPTSSTYYKYNGTNCSAYDCHCYYKINGTDDPSASSGDFDGGLNSTSNWTLSSLTNTKPQTFNVNNNYIYGYKITAVGYTLGAVDGLKTTSGMTADSGPSSVSTGYIKYYSEPTQVSNLKITTVGKKKMTPKATYVCSWGASTQKSRHSPIKGYIVQIQKNGVNYGLAKTVTTNTYTLPPLTDFKKGDVLTVSVSAYSLNGNGVKLKSTETSISIEVESAGVMHLKLDQGWGVGQAYIHDGTKWLEADGVYIKDDEGWEESV